MTNYQKEAEKYLAKIKVIAKVKIINNFASDLLKQVKNSDLRFDKSKITFEVASEKDIEDIRKIVELAYYWRYTDGTNNELFDFDLNTNDPNSKILIAKYMLNNKPIILATMRLVRKDIELFSFFALDTLNEWPHKKNNSMPYELGRLAFHPLFDLNKDRELQNYLTLKLYEKSLTQITDEKYWLVVTMRRGIKSFIDQVGIKSKLIKGLKEADNEAIKLQKRKNPKYFSQEFDAYELIR